MSGRYLLAIVAVVAVAALVSPIAAHAQTIGDPGAGLTAFITYLQNNVGKSVATISLWCIGGGLCFMHHSLIGTVCVVAGICIMWGAGGVATIF
jgi:type IV secretory pathway VirB2 component (pilin)